MALRACLQFLAPIALAHFLVFLLIGALPDPAVSMLGVSSANQEVLRRAQDGSNPGSYLSVLQDLAQGSLGHSLDHTPVSDELRRAILESAPRLALSLALIVAAAIMVAFLPNCALPLVGQLSGLFAFLPPFVAPFVGVGLLLWTRGSQRAFDDNLWWWACCLATAAPGAALAASQAAQVTLQNLGAPFARTHRAFGASPLRLRVTLVHNLTVELIPTLEKLAVGLLSAALFAEPVLGLSGLGTLTVRAIRRTDMAVLLGIVLVSATTVSLCRALAANIRARYGVAG